MVPWVCVDADRETLGHGIAEQIVWVYGRVRIGSRTFHPFSPNMLNSSTISVSLGDRTYAIEITTGKTNQFAAKLRNAIPDLTHAVLLSDEAVAQAWAAPIAEDLQRGDSATPQGIRVDCLGIPSGESSKSIDQFDRLMQWMLSVGCDRQSVVIAVGGGVVGDLAGFAAASFTRGLRFVQVPTTLLAMVDSSVGGKTGINLPTAKNMVGAFWQPELVLIDTDVLSTLPDRSYLSGIAEVVKYGVIEDAEFFAWLQSHAKQLVSRDPDAMRHAIAVSCQAKAKVVSEDERETSGRRAILNYGHTFAHAIEATAGYGVLQHGEAVAIGMQMAARLAIKMERIDQGFLDQQTQLLLDCHLPVTYCEADPDSMLPVMMKDKKVAHGRWRFILPSRLGHVEMVDDAPEAFVRQAIIETLSAS